MQPFLCVRYSPAVAGSYFDSPIVQRSKVDPPFSTPSLFFSLPPVLSGIYSSASRLARLFILISTRNVGRRGKDDDAAATAAFLQEREFLPSFFLLFLIHREYHREPLPSSRGKASRKRGNFGKISRPKRHPSCYPFFRGLRNNERCTEGGGGKGGKRRYSTNETRRKTYWAVKGFAVKGVVRLIGARPV